MREAPRGFWSHVGLGFMERVSCKRTRVECPLIAGGSVSSPRIAVATTHRGALAHARVIIFSVIAGVAAKSRLCCKFCHPKLDVEQQKTTFRAPNLTHRLRRALRFRADEAEKRVQRKRCDSSNAAETKGGPAHPVKSIKKRPRLGTPSR